MSNILRAGLDALTTLLGAEPHQQDVVYSERSAQAALSRRGLFKAAGAVAAGTLFADVVPGQSCGDFLALKSVENEALYRTSITSFDAYLKEKWSNSEKFKSLMFPESQLLSLVDKGPRPYA